MRFSANQAGRIAELGSFCASHAAPAAENSNVPTSVVFSLPFAPLGISPNRRACVHATKPEHDAHTMLAFLRGPPENQRGYDGLKTGELDSNTVVPCFQSIQREPSILAGSRKSHLRITLIDGDQRTFKRFGRTPQDDPANIAHRLVELMPYALTRKGPAGRND